MGTEQIFNVDTNAVEASAASPTALQGAFSFISLEPEVTHSDVEHCIDAKPGVNSQDCYEIIKKVSFSQYIKGKIHRFISFILHLHYIILTPSK
jgi:hypothetical protein